MLALLLGVLAVGLAGPAPRLLALVPRLRRTPRATMLLWQSVALAAVLAALGAGVSLATYQAWRPDAAHGPIVVAAAALVVTGLVLARLLLSAHLVGTELRALRRRHREQVDLLARRDAARSRGRSVIGDGARPRPAGGPLPAGGARRPGPPLRPGPDTASPSALTRPSAPTW